MATATISRFAGVVLAGLLAASVAPPGHAHHSFAAEFDANKPLKITGVVTRVEWTNPHCYIYIDVTDGSGKVTNWGFEMGPPHMLQRAGWKKNSLTIGESVEVDGWLARDRSNYASARKVTRLSTGEVLGAASSNQQALTGGPAPENLGRPPASGKAPGNQDKPPAGAPTPANQGKSPAGGPTPPKGSL